MPKTSTFLWFDNQAREAAEFYTSIFANSRLLHPVDVPAAGAEGDQTAQLVEFEIDGQRFVAFNGGPHFKINEAISIVIGCETQEELDRYWSILTSDGGEEVECGWLKDKYGVSWQVVPNMLTELLANGDQARSESMIRALRQMKKLDIKRLQQAYDSALVP